MQVWNILVVKICKEESDMIYMDNAATTPVRYEVVEAMKPYYRYKYANPSGVYSFSKQVRKDIEKARTQLAQSIHANPEEIYITSGGTESDNWALKMVAQAHRGGHIVTSEIEHAAIRNTCSYLQQNGYQITYVKPDHNGIVRIESVRKAIRPNTCCISIMAANNEIGTVEPIDEMALLAKEYGVLFHTDAVQAYTNIPLNVSEIPIDFMSTSSHKIQGPKGIGFLYIRKGALTLPFVHGGGQENGLRSGTENVPGIVGFATAAQIATKTFQNRISYEIWLRNYMIRRVLKEIPDSILHGDMEKRLPNNMSFGFDHIEGATLLAMLDEQGICASAGSACSAKSHKSSHVLQAIGASENIMRGTLRFTISEHITKREIDYVVDCLKKDIYQLRKG